MTDNNFPDKLDVVFKYKFINYVRFLVNTIIVIGWLMQIKIKYLLFNLIYYKECLCYFKKLKMIFIKQVLH